MKIQFLFLAVTAVFLFTACGSDPSSSAKGEKPNNEANAAGAAIVKANCLVCHASGINGAPIIGNKQMWDERVSKGIPTLVDNASNGFGLMPAKGGRTELTHEQITQAVTYMVEQVK